MNQIFYRKYTFLWPIIAVMMGCCTQLIADIDCQVKYYLMDYEGKTFKLRKRYNHSRVCYLNDSLNTYYYFEDNRMYLYKDDQFVEFLSANFSKSKNHENYKGEGNADCGRLVIKYGGDLLGGYKQKIIIDSESGGNLSIDQIKKTLRLIFVENPDTFNPYVLDTQDNLIHFSLCNHLSTKTSPTELANIETGSYNKCPICFKNIHLIPDWKLEQELSKNVFEYFLQHNEFSYDSSLSARVDSLQKLLIANWPMELRGYDYRFIVVRADDLNAFACPAGPIFLVDNLVKGLSDKELYGVMAHELAHVEFRHGLRHYKTKVNSQTWANFLGIVATIVIANQNMDNKDKIVASDFLSSVINVFHEVNINGYSRDLIREADLLALSALRKYLGNEGLEVYVRLLKKIKYYKNELPSDIDFSDFDTHPSISSRILDIESFEFTDHEPGLIYIGYDEFQNEVAHLRIVLSGYRILNKPTKKENLIRRGSYNEVVCIADLVTTPFLKKPSELKHFSFDGKRGTIDNRQDTKIVPGQSAGIVFYGEMISDFRINDSLTINVKFGNVESWEQVNPNFGEEP